MGKVNTRGWIGGGDEDPNEKKRKLGKELDQIRKNALVRKRDMRSKESIVQKPRSTLMKTLNQVASQRRKIEEATQIHNLLNKPKIIKQEIIQPRDLRGFFGAGIKGRTIHRPDPALEKYKNAVAHNDPLQLLQSSTFCRPEENQQRSKNTKSPIEDDHAELKMEVAKILNNFNSNSDSSSFDLDNPRSIEFPLSPVLGRSKGANRKVNQVKAAANEEQNNLHSQENEFALVHNINKGERYRRRLFDEAIADVNNKRNEVPNDVPHNNRASRHSTPDNVIFYSEVISRQPVNKSNQKNHRLDEMKTDPHLMEYYIKVCKYIGLHDLKNMFRDNYKDPEEKARAALKLTYKRNLKDYIRRQKCQPQNNDYSTPSDNSETILEPDTDIRRRVSRNIAFQKQIESLGPASNSTDSTHNFINKVNEQINCPATVKPIDDNKRKRVPSSKGSETEAPSSTQVMVDPTSARVDSKMEHIHPEKQEMLARYLEDQTSYTSNVSPQIQERHEKLFVNNRSKGSYLLQKSTKYIPAILRKNRSLAECVAKEKATILSIEKYPSQSRNRESSILDVGLDNIESEHTPNTMIEPLLQAPNCKYVHMNSKYKQPSRINIPIVHNNRHQRNPVPERHSQRVPSPSSLQKNFTLSQSFNLSPIKQYQSYNNTLPVTMPRSNANHNYHMCQLSQESQDSDNSNCMTRMVSFGDIQDRTNRLTICSQNQQCSQEALKPNYVSEHSHPNCHYQHQPYESTSSRSMFNSQPHASYSEPAYERPNYEYSNSLRCMERSAYVPQKEYQVIPQQQQQQYNNCSCYLQSSSEPMLSCCCQQNPNPEPSCVPTRQAIKFHAAEGKRRQPIYNPTESYSFVHKQPCCSTSTSRIVAAAADSSDFEYHEMLKRNYGGGGDRPQSGYVAPPNGNQRYIVQRQIPQSPPPQQKQQPPAVCQQVAYRHNHRPTNEAYKMNDAYMHPMNRQVHSKRQ